MFIKYFQTNYLQTIVVTSRFSLLEFDVSEINE